MTIIFKDAQYDGIGTITKRAGGYWRWTFRAAHDVPGIKGHIKGQFAWIQGFSSTKKQAITHLKQWLAIQNTKKTG